MVCLMHCQIMVFDEQGLVQQPVCGLNHIAPFLKAREEGKGLEKLWGYYCVGQPQKVTNRFIVQPGYRTRVLGAQMYKYELAGFLQWGYNFYNSAFLCTPSIPIAVRTQTEPSRRAIPSSSTRDREECRRKASVSCSWMKPCPTSVP